LWISSPAVIVAATTTRAQMPRSRCWRPTRPLTQRCDGMAGSACFRRILVDPLGQVGPSAVIVAAPSGPESRARPTSTSAFFGGVTASRQKAGVSRILPISHARPSIAASRASATASTEVRLVKRSRSSVRRSDKPIATRPPADLPRHSLAPAADAFPEPGCQTDERVALERFDADSDGAQGARFIDSAERATEGGPGRTRISAGFRSYTTNPVVAMMGP